MFNYYSLFLEMEKDHIPKNKNKNKKRAYLRAFTSSTKTNQFWIYAIAQGVKTLTYSSYDLN